MFRVCAKAIIILALGAFSQIEAQTLRSQVEPQARLFPSVGPGVTAVKRDALGRYYILGKPANVVSIYDSGGNLIGQIPNQKSGAAIRYAVGIDLTPEGKLVVVDRGANAIEVFDSDGSSIAKIPVLAPTSVVALPGGLFAVTSLSSDRLVQILDETGSVVRSFGDVADVEDSPSSKPETGRRPLADWGKIVGSSAGDIYFAFTSLPEPLVRRYDQYGASGFEASVPKGLSAQRPTSTQDRFEFTMNFTHLSLSDQTVGSVTVGSSGDVRFNGGMGTGLSRIIGSGGSFGRAAAQMSLFQAGNGSVATGMAGGSIGGMVAGQISKQGVKFQVGAGNISSARGGRGRRGGNYDYDLAAPQGSTLQFFGSSNNSADSNGNSGSNNSGSANNAGEFSAQALAYSGSDFSGSEFSGSGSALQSDSHDESSLFSNPFSNATDAGDASSLSAAFAYGSLSNSVGVPPVGGGVAGGLGRFPGGGMGHAGFEGGGLNHFQGNPFGDGQFRPHRFGAGEGDVSVSMRVNLGDLGSSAAGEKATITATAVDASGDLWVAVGDTLIHYSKDGIALDAYYLALKGGQPLKPTALLVEPNRFIVVADPWGIFEFSRTHD